MGALLVTETPPETLPETVGANFAVKGTDWPAFMVIGEVIPLIE